MFHDCLLRLKQGDVVDYLVAGETVAKLLMLAGCMEAHFDHFKVPDMKAGEEIEGVTIRINKDFPDKPNWQTLFHKWSSDYPKTYEEFVNALQ
jgi:hypothetical protein